MVNRVQVISGRAAKYILAVKLMSSVLLISILLQVIAIIGSFALSDLSLLDCLKLSVVSGLDGINSNTEILDFVIGIFSSINIFIATVITFKWADRKIIITEITGVTKGINIFAWLNLSCNLMRFFAKLVTTELSVIKVCLLLATYVIEILATILAIRYFKFNADKLRETQGYDYRSNYIKGSVIYWILAGVYAAIICISLVLNTVKFVYGALNEGKDLSIIDITDIIQDKNVEVEYEEEEEKVTYTRIDIDTTYVSGMYTTVRSVFLGSDNNVYANIHQASVGNINFNKVTVEGITGEVYKIKSNIEEVQVIYSNGGYATIFLFDARGNLYRLRGVADTSYPELDITNIATAVDEIWIEEKEGINTLAVKYENGNIYFPYYNP